MSLTDRKRAVLLLGLLVAGWIPVLLGQDAVGSVSALFSFADSPHPYFVPEHGMLLYLWSPLVVVSACILLLSPGLLLSIAFGRMEQACQWILYSAALSMVVVSGAAGTFQSLTGNPLIGGAFIGVVVFCILSCFGVLLIRVWRGDKLAWPMAEPSSRATMVLVLVVPLVMLIVMTPKFYWENFNGDGVHAFESGRLLLNQSLPFWPENSGPISTYPGITSMMSSFPISWFIRLFGEFEASARFPFLLSLGVLYAAILAMIRHNREAQSDWAQRLLVCLALAVYSVVVSFGATYSPYSADIALPSARETLLMVFFLGFLLSFLRRENGWMSLFLMLTFFSTPVASLLAGLWLLSAWILLRPIHRNQILVAFSVLLACVGVNAIAPLAFEAIHLPAPGGEFNVQGILYRLDFGRPRFRWVLFSIVPCGILPALSMLAWYKQDRFTRSLSLLTAAYLTFFCVQAHVALHYFVPAMLLPIVIFWRTDWLFGPTWRPFVLMSTALTGLTALILSLPPHAKPDNSGRIIGTTIQDRTGGYDTSNPAAFRRSQLLSSLFLPTWNRKVPKQAYGGSAFVWNYYAHHASQDRHSVNYVLQLAAEPPPGGLRLLAKEDDVALYIRSDSVWKSHKAMRPLTPPCSRIYLISWKTLFPE